MNTNHRLVSIFDGDAATLDLLLRHYAATRGPVIVDVIPVGSDGATQFDLFSVPATPDGLVLGSVGMFVPDETDAKPRPRTLGVRPRIAARLGRPSVEGARIGHVRLRGRTIFSRRVGSDECVAVIWGRRRGIPAGA